MQRRWAYLMRLSSRPALLLIFVQMISGMRDMPQFAFFLIYLREQLAFAPETISSVVAGGQVAGTIAALLGGSIATRLGSKSVLVSGLILAGLGSLVFQLHPPWAVVLVWIVSGAGSAMVTVGGASYLTRLSDRGALGILAALYALSMTIGGAIGNPIAGVIIEQHGFSLFGWVAIAVTITIVLIAALFMANLSDQNLIATVTASQQNAVWASSFLTVRHTNVRLLIVLRSLPTIFYGMLMVLIPLLINDLSGSKVLVATYGTATLIVASATQLLAGRAADRWGARRPTMVAYGTILLSGVGLAISASSVWGLFVFGVIGIAAAWALSALMYVWVADGVPKAEHAATFGLLHAVWSLSMISGSLLGSWLLRWANGLPFFVAGLLNLASILLIRIYYARNAIAEKAPATLSTP